MGIIVLSKKTKRIICFWYFVDYTDKPYSKVELDNFETEIKTSPTGWIKDFNYVFKAGNVYEYKIYSSLTNKGTYAINEDKIILLDKMKQKKTL